MDNLYNFEFDFLQAILAFLKKNNLKGTEEALKNELGKAAAKGVANVQQPDINEVKQQLFWVLFDILIFIEPIKYTFD